MFALPPLEEAAKVIADRNAPIEKRMRSLFVAHHYGGEEGAKALKGAFGDSSVLLVHEAAYLLGQLGLGSTIPWLVCLLEDKTQNCMVRHEAAEALGAIGLPESIEHVKKYTTDESIPVRETCQLALRSLLEKQQTGKYVPEVTDPRLRKSRDPVAKVNVSIKQLNCTELREILLNVNEDLYRRYEALFELRDRDEPCAHEAIASAMKDTASALFRHEVAFVLGQIQTAVALDALVATVSNTSEHPMTRHEAALALGSIGCGNSSDIQAKAIECLKAYVNDKEAVVAESCIVGLDNIRYEQELQGH